MTAADAADRGRLAENIVHFARVLRHAGLPIGPARVLAAVEAVRLTGVERREEFRAALSSTLLDRAENFALFDQAFALFWRDPKLMQRAMRSLLPKVTGRIDDQTRSELPSNRLRDALVRTMRSDLDTPGEEEIELDAALTFSAREVLQRKDFETMTVEELDQVKHTLANLHLPLPRIRTRRHTSDALGNRIDLRKTVARSMRSGGEMIAIAWRRQRTRPSTLIVLCDISGSMARYSRMLLHFVHGLAAEQRHVHAFTFGTRLTNITRALRRRDVDLALTEVGRLVPDWSGGTQIGAALEEFNRRWSRRLLAQGATVLIVSDGLDCGTGPDLAAQMQRLRASCQRIIWLNPLLRFEGFEPRAAGIRAMLPHVDQFVPAHNVTSLMDLERAFAAATQARGDDARRKISMKEHARWK